MEISDMQGVAGRSIFHVLLIIAALVYFPATVAQPVRDRILDDITVQQEEKTDAVQIGLTITARYISHFPYQSGDELRIRIRPFDVRTDDRDALFMRESLVPFNDDPPYLKEVVYEGDIEGGPYLTLFFSQAVNYKVEQGRDSRSIVVRVERPCLEDADQPVTDTDEQ